MFLNRILTTTKKLLKWVLKPKHKFVNIILVAWIARQTDGWTDGWMEWKTVGHLLNERQMDRRTRPKQSELYLFYKWKLVFS